MKVALALFLLTSTQVHAAPLTVRQGEAWGFTVKDGKPSGARKVALSAKPAEGQIMVAVRPLMGTTMVLTNNSAVAYTLRAELLQGGKAISVRPCTLPANGRPILEQWKEKADAVRLSAFKRADTDGRC